MRPRHRCSVLVAILDHAGKMGTIPDSVEAADIMYSVMCVSHTSVEEDEHMDLALKASHQERRSTIKRRLILDAEELNIVGHCLFIVESGDTSWQSC